jgi:hypothetical protein
MGSGYFARAALIVLVLALVVFRLDYSSGLGYLNVVKQVINTNGGTALPGNFTIDIIGNYPSPATIQGSSTGTNISVGNGKYVVTELPCGNYPSGVKYCIPLSIYNNQTALKNGTQIEVWFNSSNATWSGYLAPNLGNICFYDSISGGCMPAWLEGNLSQQVTGNFTNSGYAMLYWIRLDAPILSGLTANQIYIGIFNKSVNNYGVYGILGANPTLYCSSGCPATYYAGADNGANVFKLYDNFIGNYSSSADSGPIDGTMSAQNATWVVNNGLTFMQINQVNPLPQSTPASIIYISSSNYTHLNTTQNLSIDENIRSFYGFYALLPPYGPYIYLSGDGVIGFFSYNATQNTVNQIDMGGIVDGYTNGFYKEEQLYLYANSGSSAIKIPFLLSLSDPLPLTLTLQNQTIYAQANYGNTQQIGVRTAESSNNSDAIAIESAPSQCGAQTSEVCSNANKVQWIRIRTPPPNNVQPSVMPENQLIVATEPQFGYVQISATNCTGTITEGQLINCTIVNHDLPGHIKTIETVNNTNGGTATPANFTVQVSGNSPSQSAFSGSNSSTTVSIKQGNYSITETTLPNYVRTFTNSCTGAIYVGQNITCTITNTYVPPPKGHITVIEYVNNTYGGTAAANNFTVYVSANSPSLLSFVGNTISTTVTVSPGNYAVTESALSGYVQKSATNCTGFVSGGQNITCTITNHDLPAHLKVVKMVNNTFGGTLVANSFTLHVSGNSPSNSVFQGSSTGTTVSISAGSYAVTESAVPGYAQTSAVNCAGNITVGQNITCTITNHDLPAHLKVVKMVNNTNGGTLTSSNFTLHVSAILPSPSTFPGSSTGTTVSINAGNYAVTESSTAGYVQSAATNCTGTAAIGQNITCTITNHDLPAHLKVVKMVNNTFGGTLVANSFTMHVNGNLPSNSVFQGSSTGTTVSIKQGPYSITETPISGYEQTSSVNCAGTISIGQNITCTITNHDISPVTLKCTDTKTSNPVLPPNSNTIKLTGNSQTKSVVVTDNSAVTLSGNSDKLTLKISYAKPLGVQVSGNSDNVKIINGGNSNVSINGNSNILNLTNGTATSVWVYGNSETVNLATGGATVYVNGNSDAVKTASGTTTVCTYGNSDTAASANGVSSIGITGNSDTATFSNGISNIKMVGNSDLATLKNVAANINILGNSDTVSAVNTIILSQNVTGNSDHV